MDPKLEMSHEIDMIKRKESQKASAILSSRWFYNEQGLIQQYKSNVVSLLEFSNAAIYHAAESNLDELEAIQEGLLKALDLSFEHAFLHYNRVPLRLRRGIAVLGLLYRIQLGEQHEDFMN